MTVLQILKEKINNDSKIKKIVKDLKFTNEDILKYSFWLEDYFTDKATCDNCSGLKHCPKKLKYQEVVLDDYNSKLYRGIGDCKYLRQQNNLLPSSLLATNCKEYLIRKLKKVNAMKWNNYFNSSAKKIIIKALGDQLEFNSMWFHSKTLSTSSNLMVRFCGSFLEKEERVVYIKANLIEKKWLIKNIDFLKKCDVLFIESFLALSMQNPWDFFHLIDFLYPIIEYRLDKNKICVFSSSLDLKTSFENKIRSIDRIFAKSEYKENVEIQKTTIQNFFNLLEETSSESIVTVANH